MNETHLINIEPATRRLLPGFQIQMTSTLWNAIAGTDPVSFDDERLRDVGFYVLFGLAGLIGAGDALEASSRSLLIPIAFASGPARMQVTVQRHASGNIGVFLSLPDEALAES